MRQLLETCIERVLTSPPIQLIKYIKYCMTQLTCSKSMKSFLIHNYCAMRSLQHFKMNSCLYDQFQILSCLFLSQVPVLIPMDLMVEASPRRVFANAHTYHINSISVNSDNETYLSADDLRINLWHLEITDRSFSILPYTCGHICLCICLITYDSLSISVPLKCSVQIMCT